MSKLRKNGYNFISLLLFAFILMVVFNFGDVLYLIKPNMSFGSLNFKKITSFNRNNFSKEKTVFLIKDHLFQITDDRLIYYDKDGNPLWEKKYSGEDIDIVGDKGYYYVIDKSVGDVFLINDLGEIKAKKYSMGSIQNIISHSKNEINLLTRDKDVVSLDSDLKLNFRKNISLNDIISIQNYSSDFYFLTLEDNSNEFFSRFINFDSKFNFVSNTNFPDEIFYDFYIDSNNIHLIGDNSVKNFNHENELTWEITFDGYVNDFYFSKLGEIVVNVVNETENLEEIKNESYIRLYDYNGEIVSKGKSPIDHIKNILFIDNHIICYNDYELSILNRDMEIVYSKKFNDTIEKINTYQNRFLIKTQKEAILFSVN